SFGLKHLQCSLNWPEFQPQIERVSAPAMRALELVLEEAADYGLDLRITLFPVLHGRLVCLPSWALDPWSIAEREVYTGGGFSRKDTRNLFADRALLQAQALLSREV